MAKPPPATPNSDIDGVDRDWRPGLVSRDTSPDPGKMLKDAQDQSKGRPDQSPPLGASGADLPKPDDRDQR
ncbi:hypothetical protein WP12_18175 [Sphingomonas sp. SRS2]|nr:hypothetical protein WP12_18175 [Sphingomonas sp. SRS2]